MWGVNQCHFKALEIQIKNKKFNFANFFLQKNFAKKSYYVVIKHQNFNILTQKKQHPNPPKNQKNTPTTPLS
ncbi:MAG: hypothetical protein CMC14_03290 [Flavobacteriaceae bacterium]|nr:hypothetical protein [Flavobacteriaceae bacterium]